MDTIRCFSVCVSFILDSAFVIWPLLESMKMSLVLLECCSVKQAAFSPASLVTAATQPAENNSFWQFHSISMRTAGIRLCSLLKRTQSILLRVAWNDTAAAWFSGDVLNQGSRSITLRRSSDCNRKNKYQMVIFTSVGLKGVIGHMDVLTSVAFQLKKKEIDDV